MSPLTLPFWRGLYSVALTAAYPWALLRPWLRARDEPAYAERRAERFGHVPSEVPREPVWFHAVSAGEVIAAAPLIGALARAYPELPFLVTATTPAGSAQIQARLLGRYNNVSHCYAPFDFPRVVDRFFSRVAPRMLVLVETELWPNLLRRASRDGVPALLINGRLSARSAARYRCVSPLVNHMLRSLRLVACQYPAHADRFRRLGAQSERVICTGNLKFDVGASDASRVDAKDLPDVGERHVWIAGSTHAGEEALLLAAHERLRSRFPGLLLVLAPRQIRRGVQVATLIQRGGLTPQRRSDGGAVDKDTDVLLVDTLGELAGLYGLADVAFIGGSLVPAGGHNPIEAAARGLPMLMGPHVDNFADVVGAFEEAGCLTRVRSAEQIVAAVARLLERPAARAHQGQAARQAVVANRGALDRVRALLDGELSRLSPRSGP